MAVPLIVPIAGIALLVAGTVNAVRKLHRSDRVIHRVTDPRIIRINALKRTRSSPYTPVIPINEQLEQVGLTVEMVDQMKTDAIRRNYHDGKYHIDNMAKPGSTDNPIVVGIPECSNNLEFSLEKKCWVLTDGLGNGWIR